MFSEPLHRKLLRPIIVFLMWVPGLNLLTFALWRRGCCGCGDVFHDVILNGEHYCYACVEED